MVQDSGYSSKIAHIFDVVEIYGDVPTFIDSIKDVPRSLLILYAAHFCLSEVHNGGFLQLFWNATGVLVPQAVDGFEAMGMPRLAETFTAAASYLGSPYPQSRGDRWDALIEASGRTEDEVTGIFDRAEDLYLAFAEATATLPFEALDQEAWELAKSEDGGFQERADAFAATIAS